MPKIYTTEGKLLSDGFPKIQIGDKLYPVDTRKVTYQKVLKELAANKTAKEPKEEDRIILELMLGSDNLREIEENHNGETEYLSVAGYKYLVIVVQAALLDIPVEEAEARFQEQEKTTFPVRSRV